MKNTFNQAFKNEYAWFYRTFKNANKLLYSNSNKQKEVLRLIENTLKDTEKFCGNYSPENFRLNVFCSELKGNCIHYFLEDNSIKDFLLSCGISNVLSFLKKFDSELNFCIHTTTDPEALIYHLDKSSFKTSWIEPDGTTTGLFTMPLNSNGIKALNHFNNYEAIKLGINFLQYIDAFPDCVRDGLPKHFVIKNSFKNKKQTIRLSNKIRITDSTSRTPHFRHGYLRYLGSDYFVNKKGQTVFIEATFVNGKNAKTVS